MLKKSVLFILAAFLQLVVQAQQPYFRALETSPAIDDIRISTITQDNSGYLWLGTNKGIRRFNGTESTIPSNAGESQSLHITSVEIIDHHLLAGTQEGKIIFVNLIDNAEVNILEIVDDEITCCKKDHYGNLWIGTNSNGIFILNQDKKLKQLDNLPDNAIHEIISKDKKIIVATDAGLLLWEDAENRLEFQNITTDAGITDNLVTSLNLYDPQNLIVGNQNGTVYQLNLTTLEVTPYTLFNEERKGSIVKILYDGNRFICFTEDKNIYIIKNPTDNFIQSFSEDFTPFKPKQPFGDGIIDMEGNILLCNHSNQIHLADSRFLFINEHENIGLKNIRALFCDSKNNLWFQTTEGLFFHDYTFSNQNKIVQIFPSPNEGKNEIISIAEDFKGNMWFGLYGGGIIEYSPTLKTSKKYTESDGLVNNNVLSIASDKSGLWLATLGGACFIDLTQEKPQFQEIQAVSAISKYIYSVFVDQSQNIWFGTDGNGPLVFKNNTVTKLSDKFPLISKNIVDITDDANGNIWMLTQEQEIQCIKNNNVETRKIINEGEKPNLFAFEKDFLGNILVLSSEGFAILRGDSPRVEFLPFQEKISSNYLNIACTDSDGNIWMALEPALIRYAPSKKNTIKKPKPRIEKILVLLEAADSSQHAFNYAQNHFTFKFSATWFQQIDKVKFRYRLVGFDSKWVETRDKEVSFPHLAPGAYTFILEASTGNGWQEADHVSFQFEIKKPFYFEWWFIFIGLGFIVFAIYYFIQIREKKLKEKASLEKERIQSQFDTLRNQINPHFLFNSFNTLISTISKDKELAINYVETLSDYFRIILEQRDKEVISVEEELSLVEQYLFLQKQRFGENLNYTISIDKKLYPSIIPPLTLQLLVENAIKHNIISKSKPLFIDISATNEQISVCNNLQEKTTKEPSTGVGLNNIVNRYQILFNKAIFIDKNSTKYCVKVPVINKL